MATTIQTTKNTLYATFNDSALAEKAIGALLDFGARSEDISLVSKDDNLVDRYHQYSGNAVTNSDFSTGAVPPAYPAGERDRIYAMDNRNLDYSLPNSNTASMPANTVIANDAVIDTDNKIYTDEHLDTRTDAERTEKAAKSGITTTTPADAASGAAKGAGIGLGLGIAAAAAAMFVPGLGFVVGGGALAAAIAAAAGTTAAGAVAGGVTGYLKDQGIPDAPAMRYNDVWEKGGSIVTVHLPSNNLDEVTAHNILAKYQATSIDNYDAMGAKAI